MRRILLMIALGTAASLAPAQSPTKTLSADELKKMIDDKKPFFFLDVREPKELEDLGTIKGYVNIPLSQIESRFKEIPKDALVVTA